jgi:transposase
MRYELTDHEWSAIKPMLPNKPRGVPRVNDRRHQYGCGCALMSPRPSARLTVTNAVNGPVKAGT